MPCMDDRSVSRSGEDIAKIHRLTDLLCSACKFLEALDSKMPPSVADWWVAHQKTDADRKAAEGRWREARLQRLRDEIRRLGG